MKKIDKKKALIGMGVITTGILALKKILAAKKK